MQPRRHQTKSEGMILWLQFATCSIQLLCIFKSDLIFDICRILGVEMLVQCFVAKQQNNEHISCEILVIIMKFWIDDLCQGYIDLFTGVVLYSLPIALDVISGQIVTRKSSCVSNSCVGHGFLKLFS